MSEAEFVAKAVEAKVRIPNHVVSERDGGSMETFRTLDPIQHLPIESEVYTDYSRPHSFRRTPEEQTLKDLHNPFPLNEFRMSQSDMARSAGQSDTVSNNSRNIMPPPSYGSLSEGLSSLKAPLTAPVANTVACQFNSTLTSTIAYAYPAAASFSPVDRDGWELVPGIEIDGTLAYTSPNGRVDRSWRTQPTGHDNMSTIAREYHGKPKDQLENEGLMPMSEMTDADNKARQHLADRSGFEKGYQAACMWEASGDSDIFATCLEQSKSFFQNMCISRSPMVLIATSEMLTWLWVHVKRPLAGSVMRASYQVALEVLTADDPVCVLLEWMTLAAATSLQDSHINAVKLYELWKALVNIYGEEHPHAIVALYCMCFQLIKVDNAFARAEGYLSKLRDICITALGASHLQTINVLATLSRAQSRQAKYDQALLTIDESLKEAPLGWYHPHRLELLNRKAVICWRLGRTDEALENYEELLRARVATLGADHHSTRRARKSLEDVLRRDGKWDAEEAGINALMIDPRVDVSEEESWWRRQTERRNSFAGCRASSDEDTI